MKVYQKLASTAGALERCFEFGNEEWVTRHEKVIEDIMAGAPSGSGIDVGTKFDEEKSGDEKLVFYMGFHHMNDVGMYDGWTEHTITAVPSFSGFHLEISGPDRNGIKEYLHDVYESWLDEEVKEDKGETK